MTMISHHRSSSFFPDDFRFVPVVFPHNHNGGPPLDDHVPEWGLNGIKDYFVWKQACRDAWKPVSRDIALRRLKKANVCGLTYEEYTLVLLETGRHLQPEDAEIISWIKARR